MRGFGLWRSASYDIIYFHITTMMTMQLYRDKKLLHLINEETLKLRGIICFIIFPHYHNIPITLTDMILAMADITRDLTQKFSAKARYSRPLKQHQICIKMRNSMRHSDSDTIENCYLHRKMARNILL